VFVGFGLCALNLLPFFGHGTLGTEAFDYAWGKAASGRLDGVEAVENHVDRLKKTIANLWK
jgi:hypothetical protein